jgi:hypothetical protein
VRHRPTEPPLNFDIFGRRGPRPPAPPRVHTHRENMTVYGVDPGIDIKAQLRVDDGTSYVGVRDINFPQIGRFSFFVQSPPTRLGWGGTVTVEAEGYKRVEMRVTIGTDDHELPGVSLERSIFRRQGIVRATGRAFTDDDGLFMPLGTTLFWALWGWREDRDRLKENAQWIVDRGFQFVRVLCDVDGGLWVDRKADPRWPDFQEQVAGLLDYAYSIGLRVELTVTGGSTYPDKVRVAEMVAEAVAPRPHTVMYLEAANEWDVGSKVDEPTLQRMAQVLRSRTPCLVSLSSIPDPERIPDMMQNSAANLITPHTDRTSNLVDGRWRQVRQAFEYRDFRWPTSHNEPAGPGSSVATNDDPLILAMMRAVGVLCGFGAYVLHTGAGIYGKDNQHPTAGFRPANIWQQPGIDAIAAAVVNVVKPLPPDLPNWTKANNHWLPPLPQHPFPADRFWPEGSDHGQIRNYAAIAGARFFTMPIGIKNYVLFNPVRTCDVEVYDPLTGEMIRKERVSATFRLEGTPDAHAAYIVRGDFV